MKVESKNTVMANWTLNELNSGIGKALKSEIRISKFETMSKSEYQMNKTLLVLA
jgi:hypothetical protein